MKISEKNFRDLLKQMIYELDLKESDIISKDKSEWEDMKLEFKKTVKNLIKNIDNDNYEDAEGDIDKSIKILKNWKKRIAKNLSDSTNL